MNKFRSLEKLIFEYFVRYEVRRRRSKVMAKNIIPQYVIKRHIKIISNGVIVFDNDGERKNVPDSIQYAIKSYGYPKSIKSSNNTPLIYDIKSETSTLMKTSDFL